MHISINNAVVSKDLGADARYAMIAKAGFTAIDLGLSGGASTRTPDYEGDINFEPCGHFAKIRGFNPSLSSPGWS